MRLAWEVFGIQAPLFVFFLGVEVVRKLRRRYT